MTDKKKPEELNEADLDQVTGGAGDTVRQYNLIDSWPTSATDSKGSKTIAGSNKIASTAGADPDSVAKTGGGNSI